MPLNFYLLWSSQILSQITLNVMNFLLLARLFNTTGSTIATSLLWVSYSLPTIFFGPFGASLADLFSRRKTLMITNLLQSLVILLFIFTHNSSIFLLFAVVVAYSFLNQFYVPAEMAALPSIVSEAKLPKANSMFFFTQQLSLIIGFGFAGLIEKWVGFSGALAVCSGSLFAAFLSVSFLPKLNPIKKAPNNFDQLIKVFLNHILEGYQFIKVNKKVLFPLGLLFVIQVGLAIVTSNLPVIAKQILKTDVSLVGLYIVVPAGIGAAIGSVVINRLTKRKWRKKSMIEIGLGLLGLSLFALVYGNLIVASLFVILIGIGFVTVNIPTLTFLQENTPNWLRGRVFGNLFFLITIATIFPVIFSGVISEFFGVKTLLSILAIGVILILSFSIHKGQKLIQENF